VLADDLKAIKLLADEAFAEIEDSDEILEDVKGLLLADLDDIGILVDSSLKILSMEEN
jgi:hypothetical protein